MSITGAIVLFAVIWFMGMLIALPLGLRTHGDEGTAEEGSPASSPVNPQVKRKVKWVTVISLLLWAPLCGLIVSGFVSISDIDIWRQYN